MRYISRRRRSSTLQNRTPLLRSKRRCAPLLCQNTVCQCDGHANALSMHGVSDVRFWLLRACGILLAPV